MPRFTGKQYPGAMKDYRATKRQEAETRNEQNRAIREAGWLVGQEIGEPREAVGS